MNLIVFVVSSFQTWPLDVPATSDIQLPFYSRQNNFNYQNANNYIKQANLLCHKKCSQPDCISTSYSTISGPTHIFDESNGIKSTIYGLHRPESPRLIFRHESKIKFIDFFTYAASTVSTWYGLSALVFMQTISIVFRQLQTPSKVSTKSKKSRIWNLDRNFEIQSNRRKNKTVYAHR